MRRLLLSVYFFLKCHSSHFFGVGGGVVQMVEMIFQFADFALKKCPEQGKIQVLEQHFHVSQRTSCIRHHGGLSHLITVKTSDVETRPLYRPAGVHRTLALRVI